LQPASHRAIIWQRVLTALVRDLLHHHQAPFFLKNESFNARSTNMAHTHLATYLNNHLAGSQGALDLMEHVIEAQKGTSAASTITAIRSEVLEERQQLEELMERLQIDKNRSRQAVGWFSEKAAQLKLRLDDPGDGALRLFESLEAIAIGIAGKQALWQALEVVAEQLTELRGPDYAQLAQRSKDQRRRIEEVRLQAAKAAFNASSTAY
jgi:hypothetical protein